MDSSDAPISEMRLAQAIVAAIRGVPGVADLSPGRFAEVATCGAREKARDVVVRQTADGLDVEAHVCAQYANSLDLSELAARVRKAIRQSAKTSRARKVRRIDVVFEDVRVEQDINLWPPSTGY